MRTYKLTISTPDGDIYNGEAMRLVVRGIAGDLAVLAGHVPFSTVVKEGKYSLTCADGTGKNGKIGGGLLNVASEGTTLLTGYIEW